jgi:hypothetical protein
MNQPKKATPRRSSLGQLSINRPSHEPDKMPDGGVQWRRASTDLRQLLNFAGRSSPATGIRRVLFELDAVQLSEAALSANPRSQHSRVFAFEDQCIGPLVHSDFELTLRVEVAMIDYARVLQEI